MVNLEKPGRFVDEYEQTNPQLEKKKTHLAQLVKKKDNKSRLKSTPILKIQIEYLQYASINLCK